MQVIVSLNIARALLNDTIASIWPDATLIPFFNEAYRELQTKLKLAGCPIQMLDVVSPLLANITTLDLSASKIIEPITLWERLTSGTDLDYTKMTEVNKLPFIAPNALKLNSWRWDGTLLNFIGSTAAITVKSRIWCYFADVVLTTTNIPFINAENYLGPRTASLAALSIKEQADGDDWMGLANSNLDEVIKSNRGALNVSRP